MDRRHFAVAAVAALALADAGSAVGAEPPPAWDGLVRVKSKRFSYVYLLPGADFRAYGKVIIDPTQLAFRKNWQRDYNSSVHISRLSDQQVESALAAGGKAATEIFAKAYSAGGYPVVTEPGPDVLRIRTAVINLDVAAPDTMSAGRSRTFSRQAGSATLVVEAMDSVSGAILGRAVDSRIAGENSFMMSRNGVTNRSDFRRVAEAWATNSVNALTELKRLSPVNPAGAKP